MPSQIARDTDFYPEAGGQCGGGGALGTLEKNLPVTVIRSRPDCSLVQANDGRRGWVRTGDIVDFLPVAATASAGTSVASHHLTTGATPYYGDWPHEGGEFAGILEKDIPVKVIERQGVYSLVESSVSGWVRTSDLKPASEKVAKPTVDNAPDVPNNPKSVGEKASKEVSEETKKSKKQKTPKKGRKKKEK